MASLSHPLRPAAGFTLTELAIVLFVVALLISGMLMPLSAQQDVRARQETERVLAEAKEAVIGFAIANERLPCPASATSSGQESFCTNATGACGAAIVAPAAMPAHGRCSNPHDGFLPAATLGFVPIDTSGYAYDGWKTSDTNRLRYAITDHTRTAATQCVAGSDIYPFTCTKGMKEIYSVSASSDLQICSTGTGVTGGGTAAAACAANMSLATDAVAVIYSLGKNYVTGGAGSDETHNPNAQATVAADRLFVSASPSPSFDDQLTWVARGTLFSRLVTAGRLP